MDSDPKLRALLREWKDPVTPSSLEERVLQGMRVPWWRHLLTGTIRVPIPVGLAAAIAFLMMAAMLARGPREAPRTVNLDGFQAVEDLHPRIVRSGYDNP